MSQTLSSDALNFCDIHAVISDVDGVLWRGKSPLPGVAELFAFLRARAMPFVLVTNDTTRSPATYQQKLSSVGVRVGIEQVLTPSLATATYLQRTFGAGGSVYVIGHESLRDPIRDAGFVLLEDASRPADAVVVGGDYALTYDKLKHAIVLIQEGARLVGANPDLLCPTDEGLVPEAGVTLAAIQAATGVSPTIIGKPARFLFDLAVARLGYSPAHILMLGDRLETDVLGAQGVGLKTALIMTGVDNVRAMREAERAKTEGAKTESGSKSGKDIWPDAAFSDLGALLAAWRSA